MPETPLVSIYAYAEFRRYGQLPYAGGTLEQPAWLLDEMDAIHSIYVKHAQAERDSAGKSGRGRHKGKR